MFDKMGAGVRQMFARSGIVGLMSCIGLFGVAHADPQTIDKDTVSFTYVTELEGSDMPTIEAALEHVVLDMTHAENWTHAKLKGAIVELQGVPSMKAHLYCGNVCFYVKPVQASDDGKPLMAVLSGKLIKMAPKPVGVALRHAP